MWKAFLQPSLRDPPPSSQVTVIQKGVSECYDCQPKPVQRTYPGCTIRNTPSEPIHCIVWAKHLFNQLFGEPDIDEDVSPDMQDPELADGDVQQNSNANGHNDEGSGSNDQQKQGERCEYVYYFYRFTLCLAVSKMCARGLRVLAMMWHRFSINSFTPTLNTC